MTPPPSSPRMPDDKNEYLMRCRERALRACISDCHIEYQRKIQEECAPYFKELADIEMCKPPNPFKLDDGRVMRYIGPVPIWTPDGIKMPEKMR